MSKFGLIYAGAQKNVGPSGVTIVIVREDLLSSALPICPTSLNYKITSDNMSLYNTPPSWSIYITGLVFEWLKKQGGLSVIADRNAAKSKLLYDRLDASKFFFAPVSKNARSSMNVVFLVGDFTASTDKQDNNYCATRGKFAVNAKLQAEFVALCKQNNLVGVEGHRSVGGMRVSLYNAVSLDDVKVLVDVMAQFEKNK